MIEVVVRPSYEHFNRELNCHIRNKRHYNEELKRRGFVTKEQGDDMARQANERNRKPYKIGKDTERFIAEVSASAKDGKVKLGSRAIDFMKKKGVRFGQTEYRGQEGGF